MSFIVGVWVECHHLSCNVTTKWVKVGGYIAIIEVLVGLPVPHRVESHSGLSIGLLSCGPCENMNLINKLLFHAQNVSFVEDIARYLFIVYNSSIEMFFCLIFF